MSGHYADGRTDGGGDSYVLRLISTCISNQIINTKVLRKNWMTNKLHVHVSLCWIINPE